MVKNMEDHTVIQKGRAPTAPKRKAHTAIRSGELPRGLKERAPYMNQGRSHSAIKTGEPTLRLERESLDGIWMGEPTRRFEWESPLQEWSLPPIRKGRALTASRRKRSPAGLGKRGKAEY